MIQESKGNNNNNNDGNIYIWGTKPVGSTSTVISKGPA